MGIFDFFKGKKDKPEKDNSNDSELRVSFDSKIKDINCTVLYSK